MSQFVQPHEVETFRRRLKSLAKRGLSRAVWRDLWDAGDWQLVKQLERGTDEDLRMLSKVDAELRPAAPSHADPAPREATDG